MVLSPHTLPFGEGSEGHLRWEGREDIRIQCPAKINLSLKILNKREDGFHNLESIMQTISLYDYLTLNIERAEKFEINLSGNSNEIPYNEKNLVYKAILLFIERTNLPPHKIDVFIEKNIPVSAGLAGGSTDAAGVLLGLNEYFSNPLGCPPLTALQSSPTRSLSASARNPLHEMCAKLGSDLNFCLEGGKQMTSGRGEILKPLDFEEFNLSLIKPLSLGISAKEAYTKFSEKNCAADVRRSDFVNDLELAVIDDYEELQKIKKLYPKSVMSGSGSTYFGIGMDFIENDGFWVENGLKAISHGVKIV